MTPPRNSTPWNRGTTRWRHRSTETQQRITINLFDDSLSFDVIDDARYDWFCLTQLPRNPRVWRVTTNLPGWPGELVFDNPANRRPAIMVLACVLGTVTGRDPVVTPDGQVYLKEAA